MIGNIIKKWRYENDITGEKVAELVGVSQTFINNVENNKRGLSKKIFDNLVKIMDEKHRVELEQEYYFGGIPPKVIEEFKSRINKTKKVESKMIEVQLFSSLKEANENQFSSKTMELPEVFGKNCIIVKNNNSEMLPTLKKGTYLVLNKTLDVESGELGVFFVKNSLYVRRLKKYTDDYFLFSDNEEVPPIQIKKNKIKIFAKVISIINKVE